jgi:hypothetical protein
MRRGIRELVVLRVSHSSVETISRARRAFSRRMHGVGDARRVGAVDGEARQHVAARDLDVAAAPSP